MLAGATATVGLLARAFAGRLDRADLAVILDLAARRVHQGVSLEAFLDAYRLDRIATETGHDPRTFAGLVELSVVAGIQGS